MADNKGNGSSGKMRKIFAVAAGFIMITGFMLSPIGSRKSFAEGGNGKNPWPSNPNWEKYVQAPSSRKVYPKKIVKVTGDVKNAEALVHPGSGETTTLTRAAGQPAPTIILDYGKDIGGLPQFKVVSSKGNPELRASYSETLKYLSKNGDGTPWASGDPHRYDVYTVTHPGLIVNRYVQGGERYQMITLQSPGSITLSFTRIYFEPFLGIPDTFKGHFVSSSPMLNKIWYDGAYTVNLNQYRPHTPAGNWVVMNGMLSAEGGGVGLLKSGENWNDYTMSFETSIEQNQSGWVVRSKNSGDGYLLILNSNDDKNGTPNTLQELAIDGGQYRTIANVSLPFDVKKNTWYSIQTVVNGNTVTTRINGQKVASFTDSEKASGTIGFREYQGESANFKDLKVISSSGKVLYENPLGETSDLQDFQVPGSTDLSLILDGAKRDRAVWEGDLMVEGPTLYYSSDAAQYVKDSLKLLGSYQLQSGFIEGDKSPTAPINHGLIPGTVSSYSASYSMYFVPNLATYFLYTGDLSFAKQEWPTVKRQMAFDARQVNDQGLFITNNSDGNSWHYYDGPQTGAQTQFNVLYYHTLKSAAFLANATGHPNWAKTYKSRASALKKAINRYLFNRKARAYNISLTKTDAIPQDGNATAVLYGVAPEDKVTEILKTMKNKLWTAYGSLDVSKPGPAGYTQLISPFISGFELWARFKAGDTRNALTLLQKEWGQMATHDPDSTTWEQMAVDGTPGGSYVSMAHGWSTGSTSALSKYVLGIAPTAPGYTKWQVKPHPGSLKWVEGTAPTPEGTISVKWGHEANNHKFVMNVDSPAKTSGSIAVPLFHHQTVIHVNGNLVWNNGKFHAVSGISKAYKNGNYIYLVGVNHGKYHVVSKATK